MLLQISLQLIIQRLNLCEEVLVLAKLRYTLRPQKVKHPARIAISLRP